MSNSWKTISILLLSALVSSCDGNAGNENKTPVVDSPMELSQNAGSARTKSSGGIRITKKSIDTINDIEAVESNLVKPVDYTNVLSLSKLTVPDKKKKFIDLILPGILIAKYEYRQKLGKVRILSNKKELTGEERQYLDEMMKSYRAEDIADLENRLLTHPTSIILAQASIESGWGTSRFFIQGRNIFGVWSYNKNEPRIQTTGTRDGKHMYVKKYGTISESINDYFRTLARGGAYDRFRKSRAVSDDPYVIIKTLDKYCELREKYVTKLKNQISYNKFEQYDDYKIDPEYID